MMKTGELGPRRPRPWLLMSTRIASEKTSVGAIQF
jgi:hypothetical protein